MAVCPQGTTVYTLDLQPKWFRFTNESLEFYECTGKNENCLGGQPALRPLTHSYADIKSPCPSRTPILFLWRTR